MTNPSARRAFDPRLLTPRIIGALKLAVWVLALVPLARLVHGAVVGDLGANPVETITRTTGWYALVLLCATLAVTPLRRLAQWPWLARLRRSLGLLSFVYAALHFTAWLWFEHFFEIEAMWRDVIKRPFITAGFIAFVLMLALAATSANAMVRLLGGRQWQMLHRLVYLIAVLGVLHFWWMRAGKNDLADPAGFALLVSILLGLRIWWRWGQDWFLRMATRSRG